MVHLTGFESATFGSLDHCSTRLSYRSWTWKFWKGFTAGFERKKCSGSGRSAVQPRCIFDDKFNCNQKEFFQWNRTELSCRDTSSHRRRTYMWWPVVQSQLQDGSRLESLFTRVAKDKPKAQTVKWVLACLTLSTNNVHEK